VTAVIGVCHDRKMPLLTELENLFWSVATKMSHLRCWDNPKAEPRQADDVNRDSGTAVTNRRGLQGMLEPLGIFVLTIDFGEL
jgi:hypothetical protein